MIRHVVIVKFLPEVDHSLIDTIGARLGSLVGRIEGMRSMRVERDLGISERASDMCIIAEFDDVDAWRAYQEDAEHLEVARGVIAPATESRSSVQLAIED